MLNFLSGASKSKAAAAAIPLAKLASGGKFGKKFILLGLAGLAAGYLLRPSEPEQTTGFVGKNH